ncbi:hypothetical protein [Sediminispirochaeta bajacaliforniensis]|uniref:hypothetical protein n=1 Tax=Sediminispirochaeta bajacaliforniensis TaxID=148 RepID=UPI0003656B6A|nr:hypothetical protein [Sediminispirochaeta bajacaliforniensis]
MKKLVMISVMLVLTVEVFAVPRLRIVKTLPIGTARDYVWLNDHEILYSLWKSDGELRRFDINKNMERIVVSPNMGFESYFLQSTNRLQKDTNYLYLSLRKSDKRYQERYFYDIEANTLIPYDGFDRNTRIAHTTYPEFYATGNHT